MNDVNIWLDSEDDEEDDLLSQFSMKYSEKAPNVASAAAVEKVRLYFKQLKQGRLHVNDFLGRWFLVKTKARSKYGQC